MGATVTASGRVLAFGPGDGTTFQMGPDRFRTLGNPSQRSELFSIVEYEGAPGVAGPPPHVHRTFEEAWYVLEGAVEFTSESDTIHAERGSYLFVPRGVPHTFRVVGPKPARWIGIFSPGKSVGLIEELSAVMPNSGEPDLTAVARVFAKYDTDLRMGSGASASRGP